MDHAGRNVDSGKSAGDAPKVLANQAGPTTQVDHVQCRRSRPRGQDRLIQFFGNQVIECFDEVLIERGCIRIEQPQQIRVGSTRRRRHVAQGRQVILCFFQCGVNRQCGVVGLLGFLNAAGLIQDVAQVVMSVGISMAQGDSSPQDGYCLLEPTYFPQCGPQCV